MALVVKNPAANAGDIRDTDLIPGSGRSSGGGHGNPLQYSCPENPMDRRAWLATVHGVTRVRHDLVVEHHGRAHHAHHGRAIRNFSLSLSVSLMCKHTHKSI